MAIAIKMAMISTTTINSMRVKPCSSSRRRETSACRNCTGRVPLSCTGGYDPAIWPFRLIGSRTPGLERLTAQRKQPARRRRGQRGWTQPLAVTKGAGDPSSSWSARGEGAIDGDDGAGDVGRSVRAQEGDRVGD